ncbi:MAG TPA: histidine phosphatase family protein [Xanthobacteraceae bacterium]|nr:histidine phosphatase family protein [Xanthobacteraceae bacterium]
MTTFLLIRHGAHNLLDRVLVGRTAGVELSQAGRRQARRIARQLAGERITAVQSSPQARTLQTAQPIAARVGCPIDVAQAIDEIDAGAWTGQSFADLARDPQWTRWNRARGSARPPRGESMRELQIRVARHMNNVAAAAPDGRVVMVTHAEVIRAAVLHVLRLPLDDFHRVEIAPASISTIAVEGNRADVVSLNRPVAP